MKEELKKRLHKEIQEYAHDSGRHLDTGQLSQVEGYLMEHLIDLDEITPNELGLTEQEYNQMTDDQLVQKVYASLTPALIEKLVENSYELIGHGMDFYCRDWQYE